MKSLKLFLEGRNDPSIFHAVFMAGAPGAGKSYVSDWMSHGPQLGYKVINSDHEFTRYMKEAGLTEDMIRLSVGLEDIDDIKKDFDKGFRAVSKFVK